MGSLRNVAALVGRILLALIFVLSGLSKITNLGGTAGFMMQGGIPASLVHPALYLTVLIELGGGLLMVAGYQARLAAFIVFLWLIPVTLMFHVGGYFQAVQQHQAIAALTQQIMALKNVSMMGGLLLLAGVGPGAMSIDGRTTTAGVSTAGSAA
jgi:putative oxidoreductase